MRTPPRLMWTARSRSCYRRKRFSSDNPTGRYNTGALSLRNLRRSSSSCATIGQRLGQCPAIYKIPAGSHVVPTPTPTPTPSATSTADLHVLPAVDVQLRPRDPIPFGAEEPDQPGHLVRLAEAAQRDAPLRRVPRRGRHGGQHVRLHEAGADGVHRDPEAGQLLRHALGEGDDSRLGGGVVGLPQGTRLADDAGDVDDPAPAAR